MLVVCVNFKLDTSGRLGQTFIYWKRCSTRIFGLRICERKLQMKIPSTKLKPILVYNIHTNILKLRQVEENIERVPSTSSESEGCHASACE